jgi:hypothetical protein
MHSYGFVRLEIQQFCCSSCKVPSMLEHISLQRSIKCLMNIMWKCDRKWQRKPKRNFPRVKVPHRNTIYNLVNEVRTGTLIARTTKSLSSIEATNCTLLELAMKIHVVSLSSALHKKWEYQDSTKGSQRCWNQSTTKQPLSLFVAMWPVNCICSLFTHFTMANLILNSHFFRRRFVLCEWAHEHKTMDTRAQKIHVLNIKFHFMTYVGWYWS